MAQYYDNASKYMMLEYSQEFTEFMVGRSDVTVLAALGVFSGLVYEPQFIKQLLPEGIMQKSPFFQQYIEEAKEEAKQEGLEQGLEQGERRGMIESIITLLGYNSRLMPFML